MNYYQLNNETGKIELHFAYEDYKALSNEDKSKIKSAFLFSRFASAWVSRCKAPNLYRPEQIAKELKLENKGAQGEKLSFAEQVERTQVKAEHRAERMEHRAEKAEQESDMFYKKSNQHADFLSLGEPIKVGHHSERRHRKIIEQAHNNMGKSVDASKKAEYYTDRAETAKITAEGAQYSNPRYLGRRIKEHETTLRKLNKYLNGEGYVSRATGERMKPEDVTISEQRRTHLETRIAEETEKLNFYKEKLASCGFVLETKESLKEKKVTHIHYSNKFYPVASFNAKSVTVLNWMDIAHFGWKVPYTEIKGIKTQSEMFIAYDRDQNEVKPKVKYPL